MTPKVITIRKNFVAHYNNQLEDIYFALGVDSEELNEEEREKVEEAMKAIKKAMNILDTIK